MKNAEKDRDPAKARKRATADMRCAVRKLGLEEARRILEELEREEAQADRIGKGAA